jgi:imidazolonepropionase-like amidohydrolase
MHAKCSKPSRTPNATQTAIRAGVKCIEHGQMPDDVTARMMAKRGIWWCLQRFR